MPARSRCSGKLPRPRVDRSPPPPAESPPVGPLDVTPRVFPSGRPHGPPGGKDRLRPRALPLALLPPPREPHPLLLRPLRLLPLPSLPLPHPALSLQDLPAHLLLPDLPARVPTPEDLARRPPAARLRLGGLAATERPDARALPEDRRVTLRSLRDSLPRCEGERDAGVEAPGQLPVRRDRDLRAPPHPDAPHRGAPGGGRFGLPRRHRRRADALEGEQLGEEPKAPRDLRDERGAPSQREPGGRAGVSRETRGGRALGAGDGQEAPLRPGGRRAPPEGSCSRGALDGEREGIEGSEESALRGEPHGGEGALRAGEADPPDVGREQEEGEASDASGDLLDVAQRLEVEDEQGGGDAGDGGGAVEPEAVAPGAARMETGLGKALPKARRGVGRRRARIEAPRVAAHRDEGPAQANTETNSRGGAGGSAARSSINTQPGQIPTLPREGREHRRWIHVRLARGIVLPRSPAADRDRPRPSTRARAGSGGAGPGRRRQPVVPDRLGRPRAATQGLRPRPGVLREERRG